MRIFKYTALRLNFKNKAVIKEAHRMDIKGIKWGVWGYGVVGQSVARFLHSQGAHVTIYDKNPIPQTQDLPYTICQPDQLPLFLEEQSQIVPSPGIDITAYYATYSKKFIPELDLFYAFFKKPIIAITGSVGKTTITRILSLFLEKAGYRVLTGGNIGLGMCDLIAQQENCDFAVLEVSSFQLEHIKIFAPFLSIITPFHPNHLDRHKTIKNYRDAKLAILKYQTEDNFAVVPQQLKKYIPYASPKISWYSKNKFCPLVELLPEITFKENLNIIGAAINTLGFDLFKAASVMHTVTFHQEHRLEYVKTVDNVDYINDSKATTPASTRAAVDFFKNRPIHLLLGGLSKGVCRENLIRSLHNSVKSIHCFGAEADQLYGWCTKYQIPATYSNDLESSIKKAQEIACDKEIILLSPAGSSYDLFKDYQERGNIFKEFVQKKNHVKL